MARPAISKTTPCDVTKIGTFLPQQHSFSKSKKQKHKAKPKTKPAACRRRPPPLLVADPLTIISYDEGYTIIDIPVIVPQLHVLGPHSAH
jgi:hypothetical protein